MDALLRLVCYASKFTSTWALWRLFPSSVRLACYDRLIRTGISVAPMTAVVRLPYNLALKRVRNSPFPEADSMVFVAEHTSLPVPHLLDAVERHSVDQHGYGYILMAWIEGETLTSWIEARERRSPEQAAALAELNAALNAGDMPALQVAVAKMQSLPPPTLDMSDGADLADDLRRALEELRALPSPSGAVTRLRGRELVTLRVGEETMGPFASQEEFKDYLVDRTSPVVAYRLPELRRLAAPVRAKQHRICFTHADLHGGNILVKDNRLAGIIDWDQAGWYPEYWELTMTEHHCMTVPLMQQFWDVVRPDWVERYQEELVLECALWKCAGDTIIVDDVGDDFTCERVSQRLGQAQSSED
ncbi:kinase-like domain-containing protein [Cerioporus squamosus]|nr:kinase-like domain-containing protein [Cerioporus squamosus]